MTRRGRGHRMWHSNNRIPAGNSGAPEAADPFPLSSAPAPSFSSTPPLAPPFSTPPPLAPPFSSPPVPILANNPLEDTVSTANFEEQQTTGDYSEQDIPSSEMDNMDGHGLERNDGDVDMKGEGQEGQTVVSDNGVSGLEDEEDKGNYKPPWRRPKGTRMKRKKVPGFKNQKIKKYAQPKNAVMCLNELDPGIIYNTEQEGSFSQPFCISVEINGQKYRGFGSSKQLAKQAAAEAALVSYVKPPVGTADNQDEDKTPWATLVSFAMYKLFNDWREGRVGMCPPPSQPYGAAIPPGVKALFTQPPVPAAAMEEEKPDAATFLETISAHLDGRNPSVTSADVKTETKLLPKPAKQVPESASSMHPVMVLNQMKPGVQYNVNETYRDDRPFFIVTTNIDDKEFSGEGTNVKKAKLSLAKAAIQGLYGIESTFES